MFIAYDNCHSDYYSLNMDGIGGNGSKIWQKSIGKTKVISYNLFLFIIYS